MIAATKSLQGEARLLIVVLRSALVLLCSVARQRRSHLPFFPARLAGLNFSDARDRPHPGRAYGGACSRRAYCCDDSPTAWRSGPKCLFWSGALSL